MNRWYELDGCSNARDLGGLPTVDGGQTRYGVLLRSDTPQQLTAVAVARLRDEFGLRTVLDLRAVEEAEREGRGLLAQEAIAYHNLSFLTNRWVMPSDPSYDTLVRARDTGDRVAHYLDYLRLAGVSVATAVRLAADENSGPTLFHCAAGKDRTGVLAALVLSLVGVDRETIIADYLATNERLHLIEARLAALPSYGGGIRVRQEADQLRVRAEVMAGFLDGLDEIWGGAVAWARHAGIADDSLTALHQRLVTMKIG
ncbi:tyrosine-protein phosphatase [Frankia sp. CNm7]|uniref:Tyrosine-protein phosphatase n=1 Tax=Frankia nepalensis TaxID=1836974 RepID=A0A937R7M1_9ACTN|nr:tyrosine-protein phosphatase [Frankia nepalensis]MBL7495553.1 tyrosine-protein phosphatase [Frankia nepalensis]MBL7509834.1 tyrosine-protein phosphatase [Frankia nepalensis]MBL7517501.1 tyrosine-protein phosphatase [Frankia nepalensis]MBL7626826.1 tyrosine-protein phosphatase [Frankia nepalensis]